MKGPMGRRSQQKARQEAAQAQAKAKGEGQPSPTWLASLTDYQLRGFAMTGTREEQGPFLAELARRGRSREDNKGA